MVRTGYLVARWFIAVGLRYPYGETGRNGGIGGRPIQTSSDSPSNTSRCLRDGTGSTSGAFPTNKRHSIGSKTGDGCRTGASDRSPGKDKSNASTGPVATGKASAWIHLEACPPEERGLSELSSAPIALIRRSRSTGLVSNCAAP